LDLYGHALVTVQPNEKGKGVEVENKVVGGAIPKEYIPAVIDGIEEAIKSGVYAGFQVIDIKVQVTDGSFHEVDSNELAFKMAGIFALKDAFKKAGPILLEPIMKVEATTPSDYQGDIVGDISRRRGTNHHLSLCFCQHPSAPHFPARVYQRRPTLQ